jgi:hypothetical protein
MRPTPQMPIRDALFAAVLMPNSPCWVCSAGVTGPRDKIVASFSHYPGMFRHAFVQQRIAVPEK